MMSFLALTRQRSVFGDWGVHCSLLLAINLASAGLAWSAERDANTPIVLGAIYNLHGYQAGLDVPSARGAQLAVDEINRNGGVLGKQLQLELRDGESKLETVKRITATLLARFPGMPALLGLSDTDMVLASAPLAAENHRLFLTSGATSPRLPAQIPEYFFLACFGDNVQAAAAAEWAYKDKKLHSATILFNTSTSYTKLLQGYFKTRFTQLRGKIISTVGYTTEDLGPAMIERIKQADLIFLAAKGPDEAVKAVKLLRQAGHTQPIIGGDSFDAERLWLQNPEVDGVYFTTHAYLGADNPNPRVAAFRKAYIKANPGTEPDAFAALGYDTVHLLATAISKVEIVTPENVRQSLTHITHFNGITGSMNYPVGSRIPTKTVSILGIQQGKTTLARQLLPEQVPKP